MTEWILSSSILILAVILVRRLFRDKMRPLIRYVLWGLVLVRLLVPISFFQSPVSTEGLLSGVQKLPPVQSVTDSLAKPNISFEDAYDQAVEDFQQAGQEIQQTIPDFTAPNYTPQTPLEQHTQEILNRSTTAFWLEQALLWVWIGGMAVMALCLLLSNLRFRRYLQTHRQLLEKHPAGLSVYVCPGLDTPCLFGAVKPAIYLLPTEAEDEAKKQHILTHELTHYCHGDHIWAALRCLCLMVHWFNPLVWAAANLSRRDSELACDEATIRKLGEDQRVAYGVTLIEMTCAKPAGAGLMNTATTMTGSKSAIFERVTMIAKKPKTSIIALIAVLLIAVITAVVCFSAQQPWLSSAKKAELTEQWKTELRSRSPKDQEYYLNAATEFYGFSNRKNGIRYYGTYTSKHGLEIDILFIPCAEYDVPVALEVAGELFTHRTSFLLCGYYQQEGSCIFIPLTLLIDYGNTFSQEDYVTIAKIHRRYEKQIYGSVLKDVTPKDTETAELQINAVLLATSNAFRHPLFYGQFDGYSTFSYEGALPSVTTITIGSESFKSNYNFAIKAYKNGTLYDVEVLYTQGLISDTSIAQMAAIHSARWNP